MDARAKQARELYKSVELIQKSTKVALMNVQSHARSVKKAAMSLESLAATDLGSREEILRRYRDDIYVLGQVPVHENLREQWLSVSVLSDGDQSVMASSLLGDFVDLADVESCASTCRASLQEIQTNYTNTMQTEFQLHVDLNDITAEIEQTDLKPSFESWQTVEQQLPLLQSLVQSVCQRCESMGSTWSAGDARIMDYVSKLYTDLHTMCDMDAKAVHALDCLISDHNELLHRHINLVQDISSLQSDFTDLGATIADVDRSLQLPLGPPFERLAGLQRIVWAYGITLTEAIRRDEFSRRFLSKAQSLAEVMAQVSDQESTRRKQYATDVAPFLPWKPPGLDTAPPILDITTRRREASSWFSCTRDDVDSLVQLLDRLEAELMERASPCRPATETRLALAPWMQALERSEEAFAHAARRELGLGGSDDEEEEDDLESSTNSQAPSAPSQISPSTDTLRRQLDAAQERIRLLESELQTRTSEWQEDRQKWERAKCEAESRARTAQPKDMAIGDARQPWIEAVARLQRYVCDHATSEISEMGDISDLAQQDPSDVLARVQSVIESERAQMRQGQQAWKRTREKYMHISALVRTQVCVHDFDVGSLALFLPTAPQGCVPRRWAAFHVGAPHHFLHIDDSLATFLTTRDWLLARIARVERCVADAASSSSAGVPLGTPYALLSVEGWQDPKRLVHVAKLASLPPSPSLTPALPSGTTCPSKAELQRSVSALGRMPWRAKKSPAFATPRARSFVDLTVAPLCAGSSPTHAQGEFSSPHRLSSPPT